MIRKLPWKRITWIAGGALAVYLIVGIVWAGFDVPPSPPMNQPIKLKGGSVQNHRITTKSWTFDFDSADLSPDGNAGSVDGVRNGILFRKGKPYMKISAEHVSVNIQSLDFTAVGKVHVQQINDPDKHSFDTDLLEWTNNAKSLLMPHPTYFHSDGSTLKVDSISVDFDKDQVHLGKIGGAVEIKR